MNVAILWHFITYYNKIIVEDIEDLLNDRMIVPTTLLLAMVMLAADLGRAVLLQQQRDEHGGVYVANNETKKNIKKNK
jgi:hypothetical protein